MTMTRPCILSVVIPALNEEEAIGSTIRRMLNAREKIKCVAGLDDVEIIVVSDGSTDRTVEIARGFDETKVIEFEHNRGYGAAIKEGFRQGEGSLLGFIDADGTCDPEYFAEMCRVVVQEEADLVLGSRLGPTSKMPRVRKLGNRIFAFMLGFLCGRRVTDTASGMRVIRREALAELYPLPDRLHFTPAMSARALLNGLRVVEIPMHYEERIGISKLSVLGDGVRFLKTILDGVLCYRPERLFLMAFIVCFVIATLLGLMPVEYYLSNRSLQEWMIYRLVTCLFLGSIGVMFLSATALAYHMADLGPRRRDGAAFWPSVVAQLFEGKALAVFIAAATVTSLSLLWPGIVEFVSTAHVSLHWSRLIVGTFGLLLVAQSLITNVLIRVLSLWRYQRAEADLHSREQNLANRKSSVAVAAGLSKQLIDSTI
jgi:glycosyltransferase involved in cell wall biosynthesis